jgi:hypothetical protein
VDSKLGEYDAMKNFSALISHGITLLLFITLAVLVDQCEERGLGNRFVAGLYDE